MYGMLSISGIMSFKKYIYVLVFDIYFLFYLYEYCCLFGVGVEGYIYISIYIENMLDDFESGIVILVGVVVEIV